MSQRHRSRSSPPRGGGLPPRSYALLEPALHILHFLHLETHKEMDKCFIYHDRCLPAVTDTLNYSVSLQCRFVKMHQKKRSAGVDSSLSIKIQ
uniref:Uncharacterized protein n=1 Tax=Gasterosteus aculeatus TaxID=69293 RepID=G3PFK5_GASAC